MKLDKESKMIKTKLITPRPNCPVATTEEIVIALKVSPVKNAQNYIPISFFLTKCTSICSNFSAIFLDGPI